MHSDLDPTAEECTASEAKLRAVMKEISLDELRVQRSGACCHTLGNGIDAEPGTGADAQKRPLRSRFRARLTAGVRPRVRPE